MLDHQERKFCMKKENMLQIDFREKEVIKELQRRKVDFKATNLGIGDIVKDDTVIERKEINDFFSSMGKRLTNQYMDMGQYPHKWIIIEGYLKDLNFIHRPKIPAFYGALARLARQRISVVHVDNTSMLVTLALTIMKKSEKLPSDFRIVKRKKEYVQEIVRASSPRISQKAVQNLLKEFGSPLRIGQASEKDLRTVEGVGLKIAKNIYNNFRNIKG